MHTQTILRAVSYAREFALPSNVSVTLFDDKANGQQAGIAARQIIAFGPDRIVGHFASAAAKAAITIYRETPIPLILPAATHSRLTDERFVYRICCSDTAYCEWLAKAIGCPVAKIVSDGSVHGESIRSGLSKILSINRRSEIEVFSGFYEDSISYAVRSNARIVVLTDDADARSLYDDLTAAGFDWSMRTVLVGAIRARLYGEDAGRIMKAHTEREGFPPGAYFWEAIAALQAAARPELACGISIDTVLGPITFDEHGESGLADFALDVVSGISA
ncbi:hypothetical protein [Fulvimarina sp. MAC8]|uniref:hypothetical protein n=1 Tax=Fulvimarina sp. MAC8 TaxID=3162874 RepID=UPI0032EE6F75